jgi:phosphoserine aminotransferase
MPIHVLELFVAATIHLDATPTSLYEEKESQSYSAIGDWNAFLAKKLKDSGKENLQLPFAHEQVVEFLVSLGIERDRAETI